MRLKEQLRFFREYLLRPRVVGAVVPSSPTLAQKMVEWIDWPRVQAVIEYGPGSGAFTGHILARLHPGTRFLAIEINPTFAQTLARRYPGLRVYQDSVANVKAICQQEGIEAVDAIISGLPWACFGRREQAALLRATMSVLKPQGQFATFAYLQGLVLPTGRHFRAMLGRHFSRVELSSVAWGNFPPALVYRCRR